MKTCLDLRVDEEVSGVLSSQFMGEFTPSSWDSSVFLREETLHLGKVLLGFSKSQ